jgi:hypothetical protein
LKRSSSFFDFEIESPGSLPGSSEGQMETTFPVITANIPDHFSPPVSTVPQPPRSLRWLLELEIDGTIRYSNLHPQSTLADDRAPVVGANFFELPDIGGLGTLERDFVGFVKGVRNRETFHLSTGNGVYDDSTVMILTRSFDTASGAPPNEVVLMELKRI